ncbi:MerR family transcriptional regulator [Spirillospora albida]|uniref:transcriptional regulator FtsR n=1 Tax=Spirillospora albida TaxID=58123 RepID=UPI0004BE6C11|nr:MerR family transcriptional regulator [Spirillospora albida]
MSARPARSLMTIGDVLALLRPEFPDITISKIRFLEAEGLVEPQRSPSGYRKFGDGDVARLRFVLTAQRDRYLPLRVIRQQLEARDRGEAVPAETATAERARRPRTLVAAGTTADDPAVRLTRRQLLDGAGIDESLLADLEEYGLVRRAGGRYQGEALTVARAAAALVAAGLEVRHLRAAKAAADRQVDLIERLVGPRLRRRGPEAHAEAAEAAGDLAALSVRLHAALVAAGVRESIGS